MAGKQIHCKTDSSFLNKAGVMLCSHYSTDINLKFGVQYHSLIVKAPLQHSMDVLHSVYTQTRGVYTFFKKTFGKTE